MSIILNALKSSSAEQKTNEPVTPPEKSANVNFFRGKDSFVLKKKLFNIDLSALNRLNKRTLILLALFIVALFFSVTVWILRPAQDIATVAPEQTAPESATAATEQPSLQDESLSKLIAQGEEAFNKGDYDTSAALFKDALAKSPNDAMLHNNLGLVFLKKELFASASDEFQKALELDSNCSECFNNLGYLKSVLGDAAEAKKYLEKSISINPSYADPYFNLAVLCERSGDAGNATKNYRSFLDNYPDKASPIVSKVELKIKELAQE